MKVSKFNPLSLIGLLGFLGVLGFFTNNVGWYGFFGWFVWIRYIKRPVDERFFENFSKAGRNGFFIALICFTVLIILKGLHVSTAVVNITLASSFILLTVGFILSFLIMKNQVNSMDILITQLKKYRQLVDMSQDDLAKKVNVRRETIGRLEAGKYNPSLKLAYDIAQVFNVPIEELFTYK